MRGIVSRLLFIEMLMNPIDWAKIFAAVPEIVIAVLFAAFSLILLRTMITWMDKRDDAWRESSAEERKLTVDAMTNLIAEIRAMAVIANTTKETIVIHDEWERNQADRTLAAVERNATALRDVLQGQARMRERELGT